MCAAATAATAVRWSNETVTRPTLSPAGVFTLIWSDCASGMPRLTNASLLRKKRREKTIEIIGRLAFAWPNLDPQFEFPATITVSVLGVQYISDAVWWLHKRYWRGTTITREHLLLPLHLLRLVLFFGTAAQTLFQTLWDLGLVANILCCMQPVWACAKKGWCYALRRQG